MLFSAQYLQSLPYVLAALIPALTFHEWGHAFVATRFGDDTPRRMGRLTLNPLAHLDPLGTIVMIIARFGWAKPVPINPANFRHSWAEFWVAAAGPAMNILLAILGALTLRFGLPDLAGAPYDVYLFNFLTLFVFMNLALAIFNLIPIGPLDGSHLLKRLLPLRASIGFGEWNARYGGTVLFGIILLEAFTSIKILLPLIYFGVSFFSHVLMG